MDKQRVTRCPMTGVVHQTPAKPGRHRAYLSTAARTLAGRLSEVERLVSEVVGGGVTEQARNDLRQRLRDLCAVAVSQALIVIEPSPALNDKRYQTTHRAAAEAQKALAAMRRAEGLLSEYGSTELERWQELRQQARRPYERILSEAAAERERVSR